MPAPELKSAADYVVAMDYSTFSLRTYDDLDPTNDAETGVEVLSPHQSNFAMPMRVEMWSAEPDSDLDEWEEAVEVHIDVRAGGLIFESPTMDSVRLDVPSGSYRALITGRGFVGIGWPGSTTPGDRWRIRLWPGGGPVSSTKLRTYSEPPLIHPAPVYRAPGVAAVRRIHRGLDDEALMSGERGTAHAERRIPGTRRRLYTYFRSPNGWLTSGGSGGGDRFALSALDYDGEQFGDANRIVPCNSEIECTIIDSKSPSFSIMTWTWHRLPPDRIIPQLRDGRPEAVLVSPQPQMTLRFDLDNALPDGDTPTTLVRVTHDHIPVEWADDLSAYWAWMLERADYDFDFSDARSRGYTR